MVQYYFFFSSYRKFSWFSLIYFLEIHLMWPWMLKSSSSPPAPFPMGEFPWGKKKEKNKTILGTKFYICDSYARSHFIKISEVFQYAFVKPWSFCPCAISNFHPNVLFIYAKSTNSNMKQKVTCVGNPFSLSRWTGWCSVARQ